MNCKHVNTGSRHAALENGGRYYDTKLSRWVCPWCDNFDGACDAANRLRDWLDVRAARDIRSPARPGLRRARAAAARGELPAVRRLAAVADLVESDPDRM